MSKQLSEQQYTAIAAILETGNFTEAARLAGVDARTIYNWRQCPHFKAALESKEMDALKAVASSTVTGIRKAVQVLTKAMDDNDVNVRIRAAKELLTRAEALRESLLVEDRLRELEKQMGVKPE